MTWSSGVLWGAIIYMLMIGAYISFLSNVIVPIGIDTHKQCDIPSLSPSLSPMQSGLPSKASSLLTTMFRSGESWKSGKNLSLSLRYGTGSSSKNLFPLDTGPPWYWGRFCLSFFFDIRRPEWVDYGTLMALRNSNWDFRERTLGTLQSRMDGSRLCKHWTRGYTLQNIQWLI